jgi:hypothetical protein
VHLGLKARVVEPPKSVEAPEPRYERYIMTYPSGVVLESFYPGGATLQEARVGHLYAVTEPVEDSRVALEAAP